jgi:hypothetical protein
MPPNYEAAGSRKPTSEAKPAATVSTFVQT